MRGKATGRAKIGPHSPARIFGHTLFDMLQWIFGDVEHQFIHVNEQHKAAGFLELKKARIRWFLSIDAQDLPQEFEASKIGAYRSIIIDGEELEFSKGFEDLHIRSYEEILAGRGLTLEDARSSIQIVSDIRRSQPVGLQGDYHPFLRKSKYVRDIKPKLTAPSMQVISSIHPNKSIELCRDDHSLIHENT